MFDGFHRDVMTAFEDAISLFRRMGAEVTEVEMPPTLRVIDDTQIIIRIAEAASYQERFLATHADKYGPSNVRRDVEAGCLITAVQYLRAHKVRKKFLKEMDELFRNLDVFVTPGMPAPAGEPANPQQTFRRPFNVCGFPALALPAGFSTFPLDFPSHCRLPRGRSRRKRSIPRLMLTSQKPAGIKGGQPSNN